MSITVFQFDNDGLGGPTEETITGILEDVKIELEAAVEEDKAGAHKPITLTITTKQMTQEEYDALPEFEGY